MKVIFDTKILKQLDKEIDDYAENYSKDGITSKVLDRAFGMRLIVNRIREIIMGDIEYDNT